MCSDFALLENSEDGDGHERKEKKRCTTCSRERLGRLAIYSVWDKICGNSDGEELSRMEKGLEPQVRVMLHIKNSQTASGHDDANTQS